MKNKSFWIFVLLSLIGMSSSKSQIKTGQYESPNPSKGFVNLQELLVMDFRKLFDLNENFKGTSDIKSSGGSVTLEVFAYDSTKPDGLGPIVYGIKKQGSNPISSYSITVPGHPLHKHRLSSEPQYQTLSSTVESTDMKKLLQAGYTHLCDGKEMNLFSIAMAHLVQLSVVDYGCSTEPSRLKVIIRAKVEGGVLDSFTLPGVGTFQAEEVFKKERFAEVNGKVSIASHRGFWLSHAAPENTYAAFKAALDANFDMIEMDLWETLDSNLIVFHDVGLSKRTTMTGPIKHYLQGIGKDEKNEGINLSAIHNLPIKNRFEELIVHEDTRLRTLSETLDKLISYGIKDKPVFLNLDRSANDMAFFKKVY
ncbi:MAG: hypothetical protein EOO85_31430, partial [Pedobacter sp.]